MIKKWTKKKIGQRWKSKPIIDVKKKTVEEKTERVEDLSNELIKIWWVEKEEKKEIIKWKNKWWRPPIITVALVNKLKLSFAVWMTDEQACYFCDISKKTLYNFQKENPRFLQQKDILKHSLSLQARINIWRSIKAWDIEDSKWWLIKRDPEFKPQSWEIWIWLDNWNQKIIVKVKLPELP